MENTVYYFRDFINDNANISTKNRSELCALAYSFRKENSIILVNFGLSLLSLLLLILIYFVYKNKEFRRVFSLVELDLKIIIVTGALTYIISSINSFLFYAYYFLILLIDLPPCSYIIDGFYCMLSQSLFVSVCSMALLTFFFAIFLERCYVLMGFKGKGIFGGILAIFIVIMAPIPQLIVVDKSMYLNDRVYCGLMLTKLDPNIISVAYSVIAFDFSVSLLDGCLFLVNKRRISAYK